MSVQRLARMRLNARAPETLAAFFTGALGFVREPSSDDRAMLTLSDSRLEIAAATGRAYPADVPGWSPLFQHFAITAPDMAAAFARLRAQSGWTRITADGPQQLPASSGGVIAFKFRDPEGHPLELIAFPGAWASAAAARIDHSAISVADTARSSAFYQALGLAPGARSLNHGPEQDRLDGIKETQVEVTAMIPAGAEPHLELLCYRGDYQREVTPADLGDVAATRLVFTVPTAKAVKAIRLGFSRHCVGAGPDLTLRDPDGHLVQIEVAA